MNASKARTWIGTQGSCTNLGNEGPVVRISVVVVVLPVLVDADGGDIDAGNDARLSLVL